VSDPLSETKSLAEAYGLQFTDCGNGHVQIKGHGNLVNYWPNSKARSLWSPTLNLRESHCTPWDAVSICLKGSKEGMKTEAAKAVVKGKGRAQHSFKKVSTNPAGVKNFYEGETPPWDEKFTTLITSQSDRIRRVAHNAKCRYERLMTKALEMEAT
jgi:hypothetical protein